jgi:hypothetical protein
MGINNLINKGRLWLESSTILFQHTTPTIRSIEMKIITLVIF